MKKFQLEKMTWVEAGKAAEECGGVAIVPVGAVEEHGPHNPLGTDTIETYAIGLRAAELVGAVVTPPVWFGNSRSLMDFPGSIGINPEVLKAYVHNIVTSLIYHGFNRPLILDGHSGNYGILDVLIEDLMLEMGVKTLHVRAWELASVPKPKETPSYDGHGGLSETSAMLYLEPESVDREAMRDSEPRAELSEQGSVFPTPSSKYAKGAVVFPMMMGELAEDGHHGDPLLASAERGRALIEAKAEALGRFISWWREKDQG
jgi:creatinine amidohydrolase